MVIRPQASNNIRTILLIWQVASGEPATRTVPVSNEG